MRWEGAGRGNGQDGDRCGGRVGIVDMQCAGWGRHRQVAVVQGCMGQEARARKCGQ